MTYTYGLKKIDSFEILGHAESENLARRNAFNYLRENGYKLDPFYRTWTEDDLIYIDFGYTEYIIIHGV